MTDDSYFGFVTALNFASFSASDNLSHVPGQPPQQKPTFCPLNSRVNESGTVFGSTAPPMIGHLVLATLAAGAGFVAAVAVADDETDTLLQQAALLPRQQSIARAQPTTAMAATITPNPINQWCFLIFVSPNS